MVASAIVCGAAHTVVFDATTKTPNNRGNIIFFSFGILSFDCTNFLHHNICKR